MTEEEINRKAREIYTRCFDDVGEYVGVINALVIAVRETSRELEAQIEKMKCCYNCSKWNDGECEESPKSKTFFCADFKCESWECIK